MTLPELEEQLRQLGLLDHQLRDAMPLISQYSKAESVALLSRIKEDGPKDLSRGRDYGSEFTLPEMREARNEQNEEWRSIVDNIAKEIKEPHGRPN